MGRYRKDTGVKQLFLGIGLGILLTSGFFLYRSSGTRLTIHKTKTFRKSYVCWATPKPSVLAKCRKNNTCKGSGTYAIHYKKYIAKKKSMKSCRKEYGKKACYFDYCERLTKK